MITAKNIYNSKAYKQLKEYANGDKQNLKLLVEQLVTNYNLYPYNAGLPFRNSWEVSSLFTWSTTKQGHKYWELIQFNSKV